MVKKMNAFNKSEKPVDVGVACYLIKMRYDLNGAEYSEAVRSFDDGNFDKMRKIAETACGRRVPDDILESIFYRLTEWE